MKVGDPMYRFEGVQYSGGADEYDEPIPGGEWNYEVECRTYMVSGLTPKGCWVGYLQGAKDKFINLSATKQFAHPTKEKALQAFVARKQCEQRILGHQLLRSKWAMARAVAGLDHLRGVKVDRNSFNIHGKLPKGLA